MKWFLNRLANQANYFVQFNRQAIALFVVVFALADGTTAHSVASCINLFVDASEPKGQSQVDSLWGRHHGGSAEPSRPKESALDYGQIGFRTLTEATRKFDGAQPKRVEVDRVVNQTIRAVNEPFATQVESLRPDDVVFDIGGASGLVAMGIAAKTMAKVFTISLHDFVSAIPEFVRSVQFSDVELSHKGGYIVKVGPVAIASIQKIASYFGIHFSGLASDGAPKVTQSGATIDYRPFVFERTIKVFDRFLQLQHRLIQQQKLNYVVGGAAEFLRKTKERARLIFDMYGAYFYSQNRMELIQLYYNRLAPGGRAFVLLRANEFKNDWGKLGMGPLDYVFDPVSKRYFETSSYLRAKHPDIFSLRSVDFPSGVVMLIITKHPDVETLDLGLTIDTSQVEFYSGQKDFIYPWKTIYHPKQ